MKKSKEMRNENHDARQSQTRIREFEARPEKTARLREIPVNRKIESRFREKTENRRVFAVPPVEGFEKSGVMSNREVKQYLENHFPEQHVNNITMESVRYNDRHITEKSMTELGHWEKKEPVKDIGFYNKEIVINRQARDGNVDAETMKDTIAHEVGHQTQREFLGQNELKEWEKISGKRPESECVSDYARTSPAEDFAESYRAYCRDPETLRKASPEKYAFMREKVFNGREYKINKCIPDSTNDAKG